MRSSDRRAQPANFASLAHARAFFQRVISRVLKTDGYLKGSSQSMFNCRQRHQIMGLIHTMSVTLVPLALHYQGPIITLVEQNAGMTFVEKQN